MRTVSKILILCCLTHIAWAQQIAKYAGEFISIGVGGRALGLGGASVALVNDASAGYWNPAALARLEYPDIMLMHDERFGGLVNYEFGAVAIPSGKNTTIGISAMRLGVDGIPDTRDAGIDANGNPVPRGYYSDFTRIDYSKVTDFSSADWAIYFSYAQKSESGLMYGINLKILRRKIAEFSATGIGFDIGALYAPTENWFIGANLQDVTTTLVAWSTGTNELISPTLKLGTAYYLDLFGGRFAPTVDVDIRFENRQFASIAHLGPVSFDPHMGLEFDFKKAIALRIGYSDIKQMTLGAGVHLRKLDIDYSFARFGVENNLGDTHRISLRFILQEAKFARSLD
jgi:hypothetical protein